MASARELTARLAFLLSRERSALAEFLVDLARFDRERKWVELGYPSLFDFLHRELKLSRGAAHYRKVGASLVRKFPEIVEPLRDGRLCVTALVEVARVLTAENFREVLPRFFHASRQEAMEVVAELRPDEAPPRRDVVTAVRVGEARRGAASAAGRAASGGGGEWEGSAGEDRGADARERSSSGSTVELDGTGSRSALDSAARALPSPPAPSSPSSSPPPPLRAPRRESVEPLTGELSRVHFTVSRRFLAKLARARDALSHSHRGAGAEAILEAGLDLLLARDAKRKGLVAKPRSEAAVPFEGADSAEAGGAVVGADSAGRATARVGASGDTAAGIDPGGRLRRLVPPAEAGGAVPASVKRAVWVRDGGCCAWPLGSGGICGSTVRLQFDHLLPRALGGASTVRNTRLLCEFHNLFAARIWFGDWWMDRFTRGYDASAGRDGAPAP